MREDLPPAHPQKVLQLRNPVPHVHGLAVQGLNLGEFEIGIDDAIQRLKLLGVQVILGDDRFLLC